MFPIFAATFMVSAGPVALPKPMANLQDQVRKANLRYEESMKRLKELDALAAQIQAKDKIITQRAEEVKKRAADYIAKKKAEEAKQKEEAEKKKSSETEKKPE